MNKRSLIKSDLYRYCASSSFGSMLNNRGTADMINNLYEG